MRDPDVARLESERLRPSPHELTDVDLLDELIAVLYNAIRDDQRRGTWGNRGRR